MKHRGEILEHALRKSDVTIATLSRKLGKSRQYVYNLFANPTISIDILLAIGKIIHYNFLADIELETTQYVTNDFHPHTLLPQTEKLKEEVDYWKNKYIELLEKYTELLKNQKI